MLHHVAAVADQRRLETCRTVELDAQVQVVVLHGGLRSVRIGQAEQIQHLRGPGPEEQEVVGHVDQLLLDPDHRVHVACVGGVRDDPDVVEPDAPQT